MTLGFPALSGHAGQAYVSDLAVSVDSHVSESGTGGDHHGVGENMMTLIAVEATLASKAIRPLVLFHSTYDEGGSAAITMRRRFPDITGNKRGELRRYHLAYPQLAARFLPPR